MAKIYKRKDTKKASYYAHFTVRGKRYRINLEAQNMEQAKRLAADMEFQILAGNYKVLAQGKTITLRELSEQYLEYAKTKKRSWDRDVVSLKHILNMEIDGKQLGDYAVETIKVAHIQKYQIRRKRELDNKHEAKGLAEHDRTYSSINRELACLRHIFYMGIEWEYLVKNPVASKLVKFDKEKYRDRTLDDEEFVRLLRACSGKLLQITLIALNTGMRRGEIYSLKWENVDLERKKILVKNTKSGEDRAVPINSFLDPLLASITKTSELVFTNQVGRMIGDTKPAWTKALRQAGIENLKFHDLRHTVATRLARAKVTESVIALILGHKRTSITSRYINPQWDEMVEAVEELAKICHRFVTDSDNSTETAAPEAEQQERRIV